ncbi:hypothetical protein, partial [Streptomyces sp. KL116D]|uniref:hypothetical protein n=1 Tax=Streptomyces sp. KL116D TaxID=3045152 RepID=UPI003558AC9D
RRRKLLLGAVALVCVGTGVAVPAALRGGEPGSPGPAPSVRPVDQPTFRIAVVGPPRGQDGRGSKGDKSGRVDTGAVRRALEDYAGLLPLEVVGVPGDEQLTSGQFAARYPNVVAVVGPAPDPVDLPAGMPVLSTCQSGRPGADDGASGDADGGHADQFGSYLEKELGTRSLLAMGVPVRTPDAVSPSPAAADQLRLADRFDTARRGSPYAYDVREDSPALLPAGQLRTLIGETRPDTVYLGDEGHPQDSVRALRAAGFRGKVVLAPDRFYDCAIAGGALREEPVDDGVYRFRVVSKGPVAGSECLQDAEWCDRVRPLMTRAGALEEYEAAQAVVTAFRARAVNDVTAATARKHVGAVVNRVRINGLQGDYTLGSRDDTGTGAGAARPVWVEHREAGAWKMLGTVAALTRD